MEHNSAIELIDFIKEAVSPYHVVKKSIALLKEADFKCLDMSKPWNLEKGSKYYVCPYDTSLFAFEIGKEFEDTKDFRIVAAHTDHPCLKIKPKPEMQEGGYLKINVEVYGGPILNTWLDRPLSVAGKVLLKSSDVFHPEVRFLDVKDPILTIPNLAIHINRDVNKGVELNRQTDMIPLAAQITDTFEKDDFFLRFIASKLKVAKEEILDFDLQVYVAEDGQLIGINKKFISSPRLDNLTSVYAALKGIVSTSRIDGINVIALFDNEEIGSKTKQGADSTLLTMILEKIYDGLSLSHIRFYEAVMRSSFYSVDVAHCLHPNRPEKNDPTNLSILNKGIVLKIDGTQKYASDTEAIAMTMQLCDSNNIQYQKFVNRSDMTSGSTLGSIASSKLPMKTIDLGVPLLAMHSARELMGTNDQEQLENFIKAYFSL